MPIKIDWLEHWTLAYVFRTHNREVRPTSFERFRYTMVQVCHVCKPKFQSQAIRIGTHVFKCMLVEFCSQEAVIEYGRDPYLLCLFNKSGHTIDWHNFNHANPYTCVKISRTSVTISRVNFKMGDKSLFGALINVQSYDDPGTTITINLFEKLVELSSSKVLYNFYQPHRNDNFI